MSMMRLDKGFTLIEIAIVITIIGLLIAGVIKAGSIIEGAKVSSAITLAQDLSVAVNTFKQQYHMLPGDMVIASEVPNIRPECSSVGNNNGLIDTADEIKCVPEVLFQAGLAKVDQDGGWYVFKSSYGAVTVKAVSQSTVSGFLPSVTHVIEFANLPCAFVQDMDRKMDNDNLASGKGISSVAPCTAGDIVPFYAIAL